MAELFTQQQCLVPDCAPFVEIRTTLNSTQPYAEHFHPDFSLGLILGGRTRLLLKDRQYVVDKGDMVLIAPGQVHRCNPLENAPRSYHMVLIAGGWFHARISELVGESRAGVAVPVLRQSPFFAEAVAIVDAVAGGAPDAANRLDKLFCNLQAAYACFQGAVEERADEPLQYLRTLSGAGLQDERRAVAELAMAAGVRRESFSRSFRKISGLSPSGFLHCLRLENGRRMLRKGKSVAEAAAASGYTDQSHFHRMFVKFFSITPGLCKKRTSHPYKT